MDKFKSEKRNEQVNNAICKARELVKKVENRFASSNPRIAEHYLKCDIGIYIHIRDRISPCGKEFCAVLNKSKQSETRIEDIHAKKCGGDSEWLGNKRNFPRSESTSDGQQDVVFVNIVKLVELPEKVITSTIRAQAVYDAYNVGVDSLYFSRRFGYVLGGTIANGEVGSTGGHISTGLNQSTSQMIQAATKLVNDFSGDNCHSGDGDIGDKRIVNFDSKAIASLRVCLANDTVWAGFIESFQTTFEITDVVIGPLDLCSNSDESV
jgi:hypothetical protein